MENGIIRCSRIQFRLKKRFKIGRFNTGIDLKEDTIDPYKIEYLNVYNKISFNASNTKGIDGGTKAERSFKLKCSAFLNSEYCFLWVITLSRSTEHNIIIAFALDYIELALTDFLSQHLRIFNFIETTHYTGFTLNLEFVPKPVEPHRSETLDPITNPTS